MRSFFSLRTDDIESKDNQFKIHSKNSCICCNLALVKFINCLECLDHGKACN